MNRIYQGRVSKVELLDSGKAGVVLKEFGRAEGETLLWQHHELFQDAVNYYLVCLMAMANDKGSLVYKIRARIDDPDDVEHNVWAPFLRKGQRRQGMRRVAKYFGLDPETARLADCCKKSMEGNGAEPSLLDLALKELLFFCKGDGKIQQEGNCMFPRFCIVDYTGGYNTGKDPAFKAAGEARLTGDLHGLATQDEFERFAREMQVGWLVKIQAGKVAEGEDARNRLLKSISHFGQYFGTHKATTKKNKRMEKFFAEHPECKDLILALEEKIKVLPIADLPAIPANRKSIPDRLEAGLLFKFFPSAGMAEILKIAFPPAKSTTGKTRGDGQADFMAFGDDAIKLARSARGYVFRAFTSLPSFSGTDTPEIAWKHFDVLAFKEALKALNQIGEKGDERKKEQSRLRADLAYMLGKTDKYDEAEESAQPPPVVAGDPRVEKLEKVLAGMRQESDLRDGEDAEYGLHERTIRGFDGLRKEWNKLQIAGLNPEEAQKRLKTALSKYQAENKETIGSASLFEEFIRPEYWIIWKAPDEETAARWEERKFGDNPLAALALRAFPYIM